MILKIVKSKGFLAFCMGALLYYLTVLPNIIHNDGIIIYFGDFRCSVLPDIYHFHDNLFNFGWDWSNGLGGNYLISSSFANLFSPFMLIFMLLPRSILLYAVPVVYAIETGTGALLAYIYLKRFVKDPNYAVIGGLIYAMSSFAAYNLAYHFLDIIMLFPLLPIALEELCLNDRRGIFAVVVALLSLLNYFFFFGEVVFIVIYFFVRFADKEKGFRINMLPKVLTEAVIGFLISFIVIVPCALAILSNNKATSLISLDAFLFFPDIYKYLKLIQSIFMVPDIFNFYSIFPELDTSYPFGMLNASVAIYLPFFSAAGVISYIWAKKKSWEKILLIICAVIMFVPGLNSIFYMFNSSYYARWFYMPILIMTLVSVKALEEHISLKPGIIACAIVLAGLTGYWLLEDRNEIDALSQRGWADNNVNILIFAVSWICLVVLIIASLTKRDKDFIPKMYIYSVICIYLSYGIMNFNLMNPISTKETREVAVHYQPNIALPESIDRSERISEKYMTYRSYNLNMIWGISSLDCSTNLNDKGYVEFMLTNGFSKEGKTFGSISVLNRNFCDICSVRYFFAENGTEYTISDVEEKEAFGRYTIVENNNYIPIGFTYDHYLTTKDYFQKGGIGSEGKAYMKYLVVDDPSMLDGIEALTQDGYSLPDKEEYKALVERHRREACYNTVKNSEGLTAQIDLGKENIVFFSIPISNGWSAFVDGQNVPLLKVNNGLIGVKVPAGHHDIKLSYKTPGLDAGITVSCIGVAAFALYLFLVKHKSKTI